MACARSDRHALCAGAGGRHHRAHAVLGVTLIGGGAGHPTIAAAADGQLRPYMMLYAVTIGVLCGAGHVRVSFYVDIASGATIVLPQSTFFVFASLSAGCATRQAGGWHTSTSTERYKPI